MTSPRTPAPDVSIVVPIYNEVDNLPDLVARIGRAMAGQPLSFELLAVDDGSTDGSRARLSELAATTPWPRIWPPSSTSRPGRRGASIAPSPSAICAACCRASSPASSR